MLCANINHSDPVTYILILTHLNKYFQCSLCYVALIIQIDLVVAHRYALFITQGHKERLIWKSIKILNLNFSKNYMVDIKADTRFVLHNIKSKIPALIACFPSDSVSCAVNPTHPLRAVQLHGDR